MARTEELEKAARSGPPSPSRTRSWVLPIAPWVIVAILGGAAAWTVPRASESRRLDTEIASLRPRVEGVESDASLAATALAETRIALANAEAAREDLVASAESERSLVTKLRKRIRGMEKRIAQLEAAAAAAAAAPSVSDSPAQPYIQPLVRDPVCYYGPDGKVCE